MRSTFAGMGISPYRKAHAGYHAWTARLVSPTSESALAKPGPRHPFAFLLHPQELFVKVLLPDRKLKFLEQQPLQVRAPWLRRDR